MGTTNYVGAVVKILETPKQKFLKKNTFAVKCRVQFPQLKSSKLVHLTFWGNLARDVLKYYKTNDYILIEGYVSLRNKANSNPMSKNSKQAEISVTKVYPFLLSDGRRIN
jgi:hypothetical protein